MYNNTNEPTNTRSSEAQKLRGSRIIYADHSATTKVKKEVIESMLYVLDQDFGNPSSIHQYGRKAKYHLDEARANIASLINAKEEQIIFTSGGTEANNIAIFGMARLFEENILKNKRRHIISTKIEHPSVKEPLEYLEKNGWEISWLSSNNEGFINTNELKSLITPETLLVSIIYANNEIGTIQDIKTISKICKENNVFFHTDAVQACGKIPIDANETKVDLLSISSHKIHGPKGVGALFVKNTNQLFPLIMGGGQENNLRSGTENLPGIVGFSTACKLIKNELHENAKKLRKLQVNLIEGLLNINNLILTGPSLKKIKENYPEEKFLFRLPGHVSICIKDVGGESLVLQADLKGILASSGSACSARDVVNRVSTFKPSHVLSSIAIPREYIKGSLRLSLGRENTQEEVDCIIQSIKEIANKLTKAVRV